MSSSNVFLLIYLAIACQLCQWLNPVFYFTFFNQVHCRGVCIDLAWNGWYSRFILQEGTSTKVRLQLLIFFANLFIKTPSQFLFGLLILSRGFDDEMRALVARNLEGRGVNLHPQTSLTQVSEYECYFSCLTALHCSFHEFHNY